MMIWPPPHSRPPQTPGGPGMNAQGMPILSPSLAQPDTNRRAVSVAANMGRHDPFGRPGGIKKRAGGRPATRKCGGFAYKTRLFADDDTVYRVELPLRKFKPVERADVLLDL